MGDCEAAAEQAALVRFERIGKGFARSPGYNIRPGEFFALLGSSGCGKITLLRLPAGFEELSEGCILPDGVDVGSQHDVTELRTVSASQYVAGNIGFGRRRIGELACGRRQRVALARALIKRPRVLLLDEPLVAFDRKLRG